MSWFFERRRPQPVEIRPWSDIITDVARAAAGRSLVEVGALVGDDTQALSAFGATVIALDIDSLAIRTGRKAGKIGTGVAADMAHIGLDDESVDHVFFANSIFFGNPSRAFGEARRILRIGGGLTVCTNSFPFSPIPQLQNSNMINAAKKEGFTIVTQQIVEIPEKKGIRGDHPFLLFTGKRRR